MVEITERPNESGFRQRRYAGEIRRARANRETVRIKATIQTHALEFGVQAGPGLHVDGAVAGIGGVDGGGGWGPVERVGAGEAGAVAAGSDWSPMERSDGPYSIGCGSPGGTHGAWGMTWSMPTTRPN